MIVENRELATPWLFGLLADRPTKLSLTMHNAGFQALSLPYFYAAFDTVDTKAGIQAMRTLGIKGLSLTIPHKERALEYVDHISDEAALVGSINTVLNDGKQLFGVNTDVYGVQAAFQERKLNLKNSNVLVLGAGGAARAGVLALRKLGAKKISIANRNEERGKALAYDLNVESIPWAGLSQATDCDVLLQSTPIGSHLSQKIESEQLIAALPWESLKVVFDMVTKVTPLIQGTERRGLIAIPGTRMLLFQALKQFSHFVEREAPKDVFEKALAQALAV